jgi:hypothetical protein
MLLCQTTTLQPAGTFSGSSIEPGDSIVPAAEPFTDAVTVNGPMAGLLTREARAIIDLDVFAQTRV